MKTEISLGQAEKLSSPNPFTLVSSIKEDGSTNLMALSWWTYVSNHPALVAIATSNKGMTGANIKAREYFAVSMVGEEIAEAAFRCGTAHGFDMDKAAEFGVPLVKEADDPVAYPACSRINIICKLKQFVDLDDHTIYIGEVVKVYGDEDIDAVYAINGYGGVKTVK